MTMTVQDIINEAAVDLREPTPMDIDTNRTGVLWFKFFRDTARELVDVYRIPEAQVKRTIITTDGAVAMPEWPGGAETNPLQADEMARLDELFTADGRSMGGPTDASALHRLQQIRPEVVANGPQYDVRWGLKIRDYNGMGMTGAAMDPKLTFWPRISGTSVYTLVYRHNPFRDAEVGASLAVLPSGHPDWGSVRCPFPPHLMVLGVKAKAKSEASGPDSPEAQEAKTVYANAVSSHVAICAGMDGAGMDWEPV